LWNTGCGPFFLHWQLCSGVLAFLHRRGYELVVPCRTSSPVSGLHWGIPLGHGLSSARLGFHRVLASALVLPRCLHGVFLIHDWTLLLVLPLLRVAVPTSFPLVFRSRVHGDATVPRSWIG
jgi:hypothetical protein